MRKWLGCLAVCGAAVAGLGHAGAQTPGPVGPAAAVPSLKPVLDWVDGILRIPAEWPLPAELRRGGEALVQEHRPRLHASVVQWAATLTAEIEADAAIRPDLRGAVLLSALWIRAQNELALLQLDSAGPAHDAWRRRVALAPALCRWHYSGALWAEALMSIARLPAAEQAQALAHEGTLLARWGAPRPDVPARPAFSLDTYAQRWVERLRSQSGGARPPVPMVPVVAYGLLQETAGPLAGSEAKPPPERAVRCAALQWALANAEAEKAAEPAVLWSAFRTAGVERAEDWAGRALSRSPDWKPADLPAGDYPRVAQRLEVTGRTRLRLTRDAQGRVTEAVVVDRRPVVRGLAGVRPLFVETLLDEASLARVPLIPPGPPGVTDVELVWTLQ